MPTMVYCHSDCHAYFCSCRQVWFQNRRAKEKRLKKDAGRQRWNPYFRQIKREGDPDSSQSADDRSDDGMTDSSFHGVLLCVCVCVRECVRACVRACARECMYVCVYGGGGGVRMSVYPEKSQIVRNVIKNTPLIKCIK